MSSIRQKVADATVLNFAALCAVLVFVMFALIGLAAAVNTPDSLPAIKDWFTVIMPTLTAIMLAYGILEGQADGS